MTVFLRVPFFILLFLSSLAFAMETLAAAAPAPNPLEAWQQQQAAADRNQAPPPNTPQAVTVTPPPASVQPQSAAAAPVQWETQPLASSPRTLTIVPEAVPEPVLPSSAEISKRVKKGRPLTYEESQEIMLNAIPPSKMQPKPESNLAFQNMLEQNMPMSPRQMVELRQQIDLAQRAAAVPPVVPPKPVSTTLMVNLAPGTTPPAVRLASGYVSALMFVDSTGSPWPVASFDIGNPKSVNIQWDGKSNILLLQAVSSYSNGDIVVRLVGLPTPVTLELVAGQRVVDYRVDIHVSGIGPNTKDLPMAAPLPGSANQLLLGVLDGVAPAGSRQLTVKGADCLAWLLGETIYLRTRLTILSPGWLGKMVSPDGMQAYELPKTSSVLVSRFGEPAELKIEGF